MLDSCVGTSGVVITKLTVTPTHLYLLINPDDQDVTGVYFDTEVTAVTDLLKLLKNRKGRTSFPEVAKYFIDIIVENVTLDLDNIPTLDEESAPAIEEREYLEEDSRNLEKFRLNEMKKWDYEKDALKCVQVHTYYSRIYGCHRLSHPITKSPQHSTNMPKLPQ
ncbi:unnamed protein product [Mytilus edulis]|uniref:Uncharacterized protein n=1 Tax=Mytilus edulis TaxID=6550 RepID=A0A8S3TUS7_MYTED|nr:unnamed protein product [Mytilus edulis]